jgi:hypothetical protein
VAQLSSPPLSWRCGCCRGRMTGIMSGQSVVGGPRGSPSCLRVPRAPQARQKHAAGGRALLMTLWGLGQCEEMSPETPIVPEASLQGSGEIEFVVRALSG